jgi:hypothetical protein
MRRNARSSRAFHIHSEPETGASLSFCRGGFGILSQGHFRSSEWCSRHTAVLRSRALESKLRTCLRTCGHGRRDSIRSGTSAALELGRKGRHCQRSDPAGREAISRRMNPRRHRECRRKASDLSCIPSRRDRIACSADDYPNCNRRASSRRRVRPVAFSCVSPLCRRARSTLRGCATLLP